MLRAWVGDGERAALWPNLSGPYLTLGAVGVMVLLAQMFPGFPNPAPVILMAVVYAAFSGGVRGGFVSAAIALAFFAATFAVPGRPLTYAPGELRQLALLAVVTPAMVVMVGHLKRRAERAMELQAAHQRLKELDAMKTQFLNNAAHELRTPLTPIKLQLYFLKTAAAGSLTERQQKAVLLMDRNLERLNSLVQDLLEVARLQAGRLVLARGVVDLRRVVAEAVESFQEPAAQAGLALEMRAPSDVEHPLLNVDADPKRLVQVLFNLLGNAVKFTPAGGRVTVDVAVRGDAAEVRVVDTGRGLRAEDIPRLFTPFTQVHDPETTASPGTGLGLFISRGIVEQHGGRIWAESEGLHRGAAFCFALPLAGRAAGRASGGAADGAEARSAPSRIRP